MFGGGHGPQAPMVTTALNLPKPQQLAYLIFSRFSSLFQPVSLEHQEHLVRARGKNAKLLVKVIE